MLKFFVRRPITTLMFVLVWVVLGLVSFPNMNIEVPEIEGIGVTPTGAGDDIEELKNYVEAVYNTMSQPTKSMVFGDKSFVPQLKCI